jgi:pre-mRNA-splicing factor ISY1
MARNSEKAVTALARWRNLQLKEAGKLIVERRPNLASDEHNLKRAEKWRNQIIREIARKVTQIQNAGLGEFKIRDLNDEINKNLREKYQWEEQIKKLGGPDYQKVGPKLLDKEGREAPGNRGYKYFGAAKELPGVKELFDQEIVTGTKKSRAEMMREIDAEYYGYLDDDDNLLVDQEEKCEMAARLKKIEQFRAALNTNSSQAAESTADTQIGLTEVNNTEKHMIDSDEEERVFYERYFADPNSVKNKKLHLDVPSLKQIEDAILEKKKKELLSKYVSDELMESETQVKELAGKL